MRNFQIYGYDYDKEQGKIIINEEEAKIVRLIFELFTQPNSMVEGINGIAKYLTSKGIPTKRGG
ncbi:recombinase family protein [Fictibacillus enclensis]|uniref:recombinase family protein n=1 Tax=Fictibacillus enclensis TaxID=1017270 RepID=UPI0024C0D6D9|nr:recombinase family protein [Fictibacillus enclensis]WHY71203.1 recombinase family protein [Fictibacillus enclensis]